MRSNMWLRPVARPIRTGYPTRGQIDADPAMLRRLPQRWQGMPAMATGVALALGLVSAARAQPEVSEPDAPPVAGEIAPAGGEVQIFRVDILEVAEPEPIAEPIVMGVTANPEVMFHPPDCVRILALTVRTEGIDTHYAKRPVINDVALLEVDELAAWLGATKTPGIEDPDTCTLRRGDHTVVLKVGASTLTTEDGTTRQLPMPVVRRYGRLCAPARPVAESLGFTVSWDAAQQRVTATSADGIFTSTYDVAVRVTRDAPPVLAVPPGDTAWREMAPEPRARQESALRDRVRDFLAYLKAQGVI